ncbi:MAG: division/cell wall cluster transcriptional repressor MraZ [Candidatus Paceibacterota bacterium]|nr:division/cell wall cluster transcriptional repressor MraZ [Candidatus Paceibacterota bacterium]MBP9832020.1 division/cell wall cluster transcriptional repressor MraZ [Candidatus Paceibacterota bacterium]
MLIGEYQHTLDPKKRLSLPARFRKELGKTVIVTRGLDHCLFVFSVTSWKKLAEKFSQLSIGSSDTRGFNRFMLAGAVEADVDSAGRILIPDYLKDFATLKTDVVLAGVNDRIEVWDKKRWASYKEQIESQGDAMAAKLGEIGVI